MGIAKKVAKSRKNRAIMEQLEAQANTIMELVAVCKIASDTIQELKEGKEAKMLKSLEATFTDIFEYFGVDGEEG